MRNDRYNIWGRTRWRREADGRIIPMDDDVASLLFWRSLLIVVFLGAAAVTFGIGYGVLYGIVTLVGYIFHGP